MPRLGTAGLTTGAGRSEKLPPRLNLDLEKMKQQEDEDVKHTSEEHKDKTMKMSNKTVEED